MILYNLENSIRDTKAVLLYIVLSQQCCEVYFISHSSEPVMSVDCQILLKSPPLNILVRSTPGADALHGWKAQSTL